MSFIAAIIECLTGSSTPATVYTYHPVATATDIKKPLQYQPSTQPEDEQEMAAKIIEILRTAEKSGEALKLHLQSAVDTQGWTDGIVQSILNGVIDILQQGREKIGPAMAEALERAEDAANECFEFAKDNPKLVAAGLLTIIVIGVLVIMAPWVVEALGFAELGPLEGFTLSDDLRTAVYP